MGLDAAMDSGTLHHGTLTDTRASARASLPNVIHWGWRGASPLRTPDSGELPLAPHHPVAPSPMTEASMAREATAKVRVSAAELAEWRGKARAAEVPLSELLRRAMAPLSGVRRERNRCT